MNIEIFTIPLQVGFSKDILVYFINIYYSYLTVLDI